MGRRRRQHRNRQRAVAWGKQPPQAPTRSKRGPRARPHRARSHVVGHRFSHHVSRHKATTATIAAWRGTGAPLGRAPAIAASGHPALGRKLSHGNATHHLRGWRDASVIGGMQDPAEMTVSEKILHHDAPAALRNPPRQAAFPRRRATRTRPINPDDRPVPRISSSAAITASGKAASGRERCPRRRPWLERAAIACGRGPHCEPVARQGWEDTTAGEGGRRAQNTQMDQRASPAEAACLLGGVPAFDR